MSPYEPSPLDDILSGKAANTLSNLEEDADIGQTLTPDSILEEIRATNAINVNQPDESQNVPEMEQKSKMGVSESAHVLVESETPLLEELEKKTTDDLASLLRIMSSIGQIEQKITSIADASTKTATEVRDMHKLYHNEFACRLKSMQDELEQYREIDKGRVFDGILGEVAKLYCDHESILDDISDAKVKRRIHYMFMDIVQILEAYGVHRQKSSQKDRRNTRFCQIVERITTNDPEQHDTVAQSRSTGFYVENRALVKELVDIYLYSEKSDEQSDEI